MRCHKLPQPNLLCFLGCIWVPFWTKVSPGVVLGEKKVVYFGFAFFSLFRRALPLKLDSMWNRS